MPLRNLGFPNWAGEDYAPQISPDGRILIFQSDRPGGPEGSNLWFTLNKNAAERMGEPEWTVPVPLRFPLPGTLQTLTNGPFTFNGDGFEGHASFVWRNGSPVEVYFTGQRDDASMRDGFAGLNIYFSRFRDGAWSKPEHLTVINSDWDDRMPCITSDGTTLFFVSDRPGGMGGSDIWISYRNLKTGRWSEPVNGGKSWNTEYNEIAPSVSPDGRSLFFSSDRPGGAGHYDLYMSRLVGGRFEKAENLGLPFNSERDDEYLSMTEDGLWAFLASDRRDENAKGGFDLYRLGVPERLRNAVEVLFTGSILDGGQRKALGVEATIEISYDEDVRIETSEVFGKELRNNFAVKLYSGREYRIVVRAPGFHPQTIILDYKGNVPAGRIDRRDIVMEPVLPGTKERIPGEERAIPGIVLDDSTGLALAGSTVELERRGKRPEPVILDRDARFVVRVEDGMDFDLSARAPGYVPLRRRIIASPDLKEIVLRLKPSGGDACPGEAPECIDNLKVYFETDSAALTVKDSATVDLVARIMKAQPELVIEVQGHTDSTATAAYNQALSEKRAAVVKERLVSRGIEGSRIIVRGYGFARRFAVPDQDPKSKALNRRVEFRRIKK